MAAAFFVYAGGVVAAEEPMLLQLFSEEYPVYLRRTPQFFRSFSAFASGRTIEVNSSAPQRDIAAAEWCGVVPDCGGGCGDALQPAVGRTIFGCLEVAVAK